MIQKIFTSLIFICSFALYNTVFGQNFETRWYVPAGTTTITFNALTSGTVSYTWDAPGSGSGNGTFNRSTPGSVTVTIFTIFSQYVYISMQPQNLRRFYIENGQDKLKLESVIDWGSVPWSSMQHMFYGCSGLNISTNTIPDLSNVTNMVDMFRGCSSFTGSSNMGNWDVSNVIDMGGMFRGATSFNRSIGNWNVSNVSFMSYMFDGASAFNQPIGNWNVSNVTRMRFMFREAYAFNQPIGNWNVSNVNNMEEMFKQASAFNQPISNWNVSNVTDMAGMFLSANSFNQSIGNWDVSNVTNMQEMFAGTTFNQPIGNWNVSNVTNMLGMFGKAQGFNQTLGDWVLHPNVNMQDMIDGPMSCANYSATLIGWRHNNPNVTGRNLGTSFGIEYGTNAVESRNILINSRGWTISGDRASGTFCANCTTTTTVTPTHTTCGQNNGSVTANPSGGPGYTYAWSNGGTNETIANLAAGNYTVTVTDWLGCTATASATVNTSTPITTTITPNHTTCALNNGSATANPSGGAGYTYAWSNGTNTQTISNLAQGNYTVTVTSNQGCTTTGSITINSSNPLVVTTNSTDESCFNCNNGSATANPNGGAGFTYAWSNGGNSQTISNLAPGIYTVTVTNSDGCTQTASATVNVFGCDEITLETDVENAYCYSDLGVVLVIASGGNAPYTYEWSNGEINAKMVAPAGFYTVKVVDVSNCSNTATVIIDQPQELTVNIEETGDVHTAIVTGGTAPYSYLWSTGEEVDQIILTESGEYTVTVTDYNGCITIATTQITVSTKDNQIENLNVFPNPFTREVNLGRDLSGSHFKVTTLTGMTVQAGVVSGSSIDIEAETSGVLLLFIQIDLGTQYITKIVKY